MPDKHHLTFQEVYREFYSWKQVFNDLVADIKTSRQMKVIYNIDFSYLFDYIWDKPAVDVPAFVPGGRQLFMKFLEHDDKFTDFKLVFTGPSFYELLDSIKHKINEVRGYMYSSNTFYGRLTNALEKANHFDDIDSIFVTSRISSTILNYLPTLKNETQINNSFNKIREVFNDKNALKGIGDFIDSKMFFDNWDTFKKSYKILLDTMMKNPRRGETRKEKHMKFHYGVDSSNIVTTIKSNILENNCKILFVTQDYLRKTYCANEGRSPYVPYFMVTAKVLEEQNIIGSPEDYFMDLTEKATSILRDLDKFSNLDLLPRKTEEAILSFFRDDMRDLGGAEQNQLKDETHSIESIKSVFKDKDRFESSFYQSNRQLESIGNFLVSRYKMIVEKDPIVGIMEDDTENAVMKDIREAFLNEKKSFK